MKNPKTKISRKDIKRRKHELEKARSDLDSIPRKKAGLLKPLFEEYSREIIGLYSGRLGPVLVDGVLGSVGCKICGQISPVYVASWRDGVLVWCMLCGGCYG